MVPRSVAQFGRALRSGRRGRVFESRRADKIRYTLLGVPYFHLTHNSNTPSLAETEFSNHVPPLNSQTNMF